MDVPVPVSTYTLSLKIKLTPSLVDQTKSSTYKLSDEGAFQIEYGDNTGANGDYITDTMSIGGATITALEMGLAYNASSATGVMGIGYDINEASDDSQGQVNPFVYPSIIDTMVSQGLINTKAYSLYLDDLEASTGSIIFGGYDTDKYHGTLYQLPIVQEGAQNGSNLYVEFGVTQTGLSITNQSGITTTITNSTYSTPAILDSGTALAYLPGDLTADIVSALNGLDDTANSGNIYVDCGLLKDTSMTFNFGFGGSSGSSGVTIKVPVSELVFKLTGMFAVDPDTLPKLPYTACALGIQSGDPGPYILGDVFLRSAYVVYDLKNNVIGIAQTNFGSTTSNVIEFQSSATSIPTQTGVATGAVVDPTGTKNAGVSSVSGFDMRRWLVLGLSAGFAVLGGLLIV